MILFVGLGNPTKEYKNTRHNIGFMVINHMINYYKATPINKAEFKGELFKHDKMFFLKPLTYMNLSGESVAAVANYYKLNEIIIIHDDIAIPFGSIRIKKGGSSGGHNGIKSIDSHVGNDYVRIRLGIGAPENKDKITNFVLEKFSKEEEPCVLKMIEYSKDIIEALTKYNLEDVIIKFTSKKGIC